MALKKFTDFEHSIEEDDKNFLSSDFVSAKKELLNAARKEGSDKFLHSLIEDKGEDIVAIATGGEHMVIVKVIGYDVKK